MCYYHVTCVCSRYNVRSDWLIVILRHYFPVLLTADYGAAKTKQKVRKSHVINYLLTSNVRSLRENMGLRPCHKKYLAIAQSIRQGLGRPRFSRKDLTLV